VVLGPKADGYYPVVKGLNAGEKVVTEGNFLIDSQMQLLGKPSLLFREGSALDKPNSAEEVEVQSKENKHSTVHIIDESVLKQVTGNILANYYRIAEKLENDSIEEISEGLDLIISHSRKIKEMKLDIPEGSLETLSEIAGKIGSGATEMKGQGLEETRERFKGLSQSMISYMKASQGRIKGFEKIYVYYCPMAGASWLQKAEGTRNPYYGSSMLKCGSVKEELP
jgi:Cu(I)/Ag(I) efflux system membrane fusion protein